MNTKLFATLISVWCGQYGLPVPQRVHSVSNLLFMLISVPKVYGFQGFNSNVLYTLGITNLANLAGIRQAVTLCKYSG